jgi:hypothetical protein
MATTVEKIKEIFTYGLSPSETEAFKDKITETRVKSTNGMNKNGNVLTIGHDEDLSDLYYYMLGIAKGNITKAKSENSIDLAAQRSWEKANKIT